MLDKFGPRVRIYLTLNKGVNMKNVILSVLVIGLIGCEDVRYEVHPEKVIEKEIIKEVPVEIEKEHEFLYAGYFNLDGPSDANCIYLDEKQPNVVDIETDCQSLVTINPENDTLGQFPSISASNLLVIDGEIRYTRNLNYSSGNDIEEDVSGSNITGNRRTDFLFQKVDNRLKLTIRIYKNANNNNLNYIVAERVFNEL